jgi:uncharacterized protein (TIGR03435 family)
LCDATGLQGHYDIRLGPGRDGALRQQDDMDMLSSQMAGFREQTGLRLEARKAPLDASVIDHVESAPSEN